MCAEPALALKFCGNLCPAACCRGAGQPKDAHRGAAQCDQGRWRHPACLAAAVLCRCAQLRVVYQGADYLPQAVTCPVASGLAEQLQQKHNIF